MQKPGLVFCSNGIRLWDLPDEFLHSLSLGMSISMLLLRCPCKTSEFRHDNSLGNFQFNIFRPMINLGFDLNMHATEIYSWCPMKCSIMTFILGDFIRHGLSNLHTTSHATIPFNMVCNAIKVIRRKRYDRRWRKLRLIIRLLHMLGG